MASSFRPRGYVPPEREKDRFNCPSCGAFAAQSWHALGYEEHDGAFGLTWKSMQSLRLPNLEDRTVSTEHIWRGARCASCNAWSVWRQNTMIYPQRRVGDLPHPDMPEEVKTLYVEATRVAAVSPRAGAAFARVAIERLLKTLDSGAPTKTNLAGYIDRVRPRVSSPLARLLDVVRVTGNQALHVDEQPPELVVLILDEDQPDVLETLLETTNDLVDELITRDQRSRELRDKLPDTVKAQIPDPDAPAAAG
ncbi:DUF4145 domain-containing protein [Amycolatopsis sp. NPDC023774]|uniref:DUF4145 domain-containing protein n=1 Tax=Amycolatopsis sp. NPDC023774 TaxID=3155015 RepID=UPI0033D4644C